MRTFPKIAIIYLSYNSESYLDDVVSSLKHLTYPKDKVEFVVVDNPHPEHGDSMKILREKFLPISGGEIPHVTLLGQKTNLGFAGGNNVGIKWAIDAGFDYIFLHNHDGFIAAGSLEPLVEAMEADDNIGAAQPMILLHPETDLVNTSGNAFQYLGFGYCDNFRKRFDARDFKEAFETSYASGAAVLLRVDLLKKFGGWDEDYFMYHEDIEYSFRLRAAGYKIIVVRDSIFYHKYQFSRLKEKMYYIERNRFGLLISYLKISTLLLLLPMAIILELGLLLYALKCGWIKQKLVAYRYWLQASNWRLWLAKRRRLAQIRKISDRNFICSFTGKISFGDKDFNSSVLRYVGNPIMSAYWFVIKNLIFW
ncbi:MAG: glycosyltransferase family 2 protein [Patescibacteria group bacterium]